jgi:hypothetical protein
MGASIPEGDVFFPFLSENPIEAALYFGRGFHHAADQLVETYGTGGHPDYMALPVMFLYRHAAELYIKSVIWMGDDLLKHMKRPESGANAIGFSTHSINKLLPYAAKVIDSLNIPWNATERGEFETALIRLRDLDAVDPNSFAFRYPITKAGAATHPTDLALDLVRIKHLLSDALEGWHELALSVEAMRDNHLTL